MRRADAAGGRLSEQRVSNVFVEVFAGGTVQ